MVATEADGTHRTANPEETKPRQLTRLRSTKLEKNMRTWVCIAAIAASTFMWPAALATRLC